MLSPLFYIQAITLALSQIWVNKMRAFLTTLGIIIGVASITSVIAALSGLKTSILTEFEKIGANKIFVFPNRPEGQPRNLYPLEKVRLRMEELNAIREHCPSLAALTPDASLGLPVQFQDRVREGVTITGIWPAWHEIENRQVLAGRPFTQIDEDNARQVCLVNEDAIRELGLNADPTGQHVLINNRDFLIVGVVETIESGMFRGDSAGAEMFIPFSTCVRMQSENFIFIIRGKVRSPDVAEEAKAEISFVMRKMRGLTPDDPQTFEVAAIDQFIDQFKVIAAGITGVAAGIVGISLLVGGIGIMNIMLVAVSERTREIGLRKAVGATPSAIMVQFLLEAVALCTLGGLIGVLMGEGFALAVSKIPGVELQASVPWWAVITSFGFCAFVGVAFGMFPAIKAARLDPIEALRHE